MGEHGAPRSAKRALGPTLDLSSRLANVLTAATAVALAAACGASAGVRAARQGDRAALGRAISADRAAGRLDASEIEGLATASADRDLRSSPASGAKLRIEEVSPCARHLESALESRSFVHDEAGAAAAMALLEADLKSSEHFASAYLMDADPAWRAVGARASKGKKWGPSRRERIVDVDERVRIAALRASAEARDPEDGPALLEAVRLDPNGLARTTAVRAAGAIGGESMVLGLRDRFAAAEEPVRVAIIDAWTMPGMIDRGGERELAAAAEQQRGTVAVEAAAALLQRPATVALGRAVLARWAHEGSPATRALAVARLPSDESSAALLTELSRDPDGAMRAAALTRLLSFPAKRRDALTMLRDLSAHGNVYARDALAGEGDRDALRELTGALKAPDPATRLSAGRELVAARDLADATDLLADPDPSVRIPIACSLLLATGSPAPLIPPVH